MSIPHFVPRSEWGAVAGGALSSLDVSTVAIHWAGTPSGDPPHTRCASIVRGFQRYHIDTQGWVDIAYNLVVCAHGYVFEGRGIGKRSAANGDAKSNLSAYAICYLLGAGEPFTDEAKDAINDGAAALGATKWTVHGDWVDTACPGAAITAWVRSGHDRPTPAPKPAPEPLETLPMNVTYNFDGHIWAYANNRLVRLGHPLQAEAAREAGAVDLGDRDETVHQLYTAFAGPEQVIVIGDTSALRG